MPHTYVDPSDLPDSFTWSDVDGVSYITKNLNQHVPQYCGSCWAHGSLSALADRIKIARNAEGTDINLSIQFILNCGSELAGSCYGGYHTTTYQFIKETGYVPYDSCQPYVACSSDSKEGFCDHVDTTCSAKTTCMTCNTFSSNGGTCSEIDIFPNATVAEYGLIENDPDATKAEIYTRGPVAAVINAEPILNWKGGIFSDDTADQGTNHIVSIVGWGKEGDKSYWIVRNSWGEYWGEMGFIRVEIGKNILGLESEIGWATPGDFTVDNFPCGEDGTDCNNGNNYRAQVYVDPSENVAAVQRRLEAHK